MESTKESKKTMEKDTREENIIKVEEHLSLEV